MEQLGLLFCGRSIYICRKPYAKHDGNGNENARQTKSLMIKMSLGTFRGRPLQINNVK